MSDDKRIVAVKKVSLEGLSEEWGPECYAYVRRSGHEDGKELREANLEGMKPEEADEWQRNFVAARFLGGKIKVFNDGQFELVDMLPEDTHATADISDRLFFGIVGVDTDPKAIREAAESSASPTNEEKPTETESSEDSKSQSTSPTK